MLSASSSARNTCLQQHYRAKLLARVLCIHSTLQRRHRAAVYCRLNNVIWAFQLRSNVEQGDREKAKAHPRTDLDIGGTAAGRKCQFGQFGTDACIAQTTTLPTWIDACAIGERVTLVSSEAATNRNMRPNLCTPKRKTETNKLRHPLHTLHACSWHTDCIMGGYFAVSVGTARSRARVHTLPIAARQMARAFGVVQAFGATTIRQRIAAVAVVARAHRSA